ncbi:MULTISPECIES: primary-amine oxidase [Cryobacterium]|uniref:Amine oxidase n=1 Tax=Cryobacterium glucosi TaxID=1259175 RepID=A0ABY2II91_9MICO|nr:MULTISPECIES: primary-amine oxidase [Cryobacterium]MEB0003157.1 primary-amine oxidase [Cryobacterium sp. RTC2.1]MEB0285363.1 primary-amine oxidase [Cryobacterium sp. 10S3]MEB0304613.1 primary-amine oxidase [Cryobacterium sp. 10I1]TFB93079.1 primary-amine oxidase [Cryobacterium sp. MDB2-A-1]TFC04909.1 primary-amine oxidase [Cryobacterium sp. MDB2-33-2]
MTITDLDTPHGHHEHGGHDHDHGQHDAGTVPSHPVGSLTAAEFETVRDVVTAGADWNATTRFAYVGLWEPHKREVLAWQDGTGPLPDRQARVMLLDMETGRSTDNIVSIPGRAVLTTSVLDGSAGQLPVLLAEFDAIAGIVAEDPRWVAALAARGTTIEEVVVVPLSAGHYDYPEEVGRRIVRVLAFRQDYPEDHPWAHPVDGLSAYVDTASRTITRLIDVGTLDIPAESGNFDDPAVQGAPLTTLKPIVISQPEGPSFTVDGEWVSWANWKFQVGFDTREGLVLRQLSFTDAGEERPVIYRASINEMLVPYGDPSPVRFWQNYFDTGEYLFGRFTNSLALGCDCVGEIKYFDAVLADELGNPFTIKNGICMHEEDVGTLWKHGDMFTGSNEVRRQRRLVISFFTTVGNYDYGFYWYLSLDGTIECEAKLTGILFTSAYPGIGEPIGETAIEGDYAYASEVAPGLGAPYHQHLFSARLDMMVDGLSNAVDEIDGVRLPMGPGNPHGNAFTKKTTRLTSEAGSGRVADASVARAWHIVNTEKTNRLGRPTGYVLQPEQSPTLMADPGSSIAKRAEFATKHLFVTQYDPAEQFAAGDFVHQNPGGDGITKYIAGDRSIDGEDIVLWHTFGPTHFPRIEDWPVMPVDYAKFTLKPYGFFGANPAMNVPANEPVSHCSHGHDGAAHEHTHH